MEKLKINAIISRSARNFITSAALVWLLGLWAASCWKTTSKDINDSRHKVELLSINIPHYIDARKKLVNEYNNILAYPRTEANEFEIDNHLSLLEEQIYEYDEKIRKLVEEKVDAEATLNKKIGDRWTMWVHPTIDPDKWDYLLTIQ
jgi:hypothetical protein